jgi:putative transposase
MSRKGNCWDNAVAENFFSTLKTECCFEHGVFDSRKLARSNIFEYIETFYSSKRMHSYNDFLIPDQFEAM